MFWRGLGNPETSDNRRRAGRVFAQHITCSLGTVLDLSATGLRAKCGRRPSVGQGDRFSMTIQGYSGDIVVIARCSWVRKTGWFAHEIGVEFTQVSDAARAGISEIGRGASTNETILPDLDRHRRTG